MENNNVFFDLDCTFFMTNVQAHAKGLKKDSKGNCAHQNLIKGNYEEINFPVIFKQKYGKKWTDILGTGYASLLLISDRMKNILEENKLIGWKTFTIKLYDNKDNEIFGYYGFSITGQCSPIDYSKSKVIEKRRVLAGPICKFYKGEYIDVESWDKTDFFIPDSTTQIVVTKKAADILKKNKISNLALENLKDSEIDVDIVGKYHNKNRN